MKFTWLSVITIFIIALLLLNSCFVVFGVYKKFGLVLKKEKKKTKSGLKGELKKDLKVNEILSSIFVVFAVSVGLLVDKVAPESYLVKFISEYGLWVYIAWCFIIPILIMLVIEMTCLLISVHF